MVPVTVADLELFEAPDPRVTAGSTIGNRAGFQGLDDDADSGLVYVRNRWFDPDTAHFASTDPKGFLDGPSLYQYALNNPADTSDPLGLRASKRGSETRNAGKGYTPIWVPINPIRSSSAWSLAEIRDQLNLAYKILREKAGIYIYWSSNIREEALRPGPRPVHELDHDLLNPAAEALVKSSNNLQDALRVFYVYGPTDSEGEGGRSNHPKSPSDRYRSASVYRYWRNGERTLPDTTAHELAHAIGNLCDSGDLCGFDAPTPDYGGLMYQPNPVYKGVHGQELNAGEIRWLRLYAREISTAAPW